MKNICIINSKKFLGTVSVPAWGMFSSSSTFAQAERTLPFNSTTMSSQITHLSFLFDNGLIGKMNHLLCLFKK